MRILIIADSLPTESFKRSSIFAFDDYLFYKDKGFDIKYLVLYRITFERHSILKPIEQIKKTTKQLNEIKKFCDSKEDSFECIPYISMIKPYVGWEDAFLFKKSKFASTDFDLVVVHSMLHTGLNINWVRENFPFSKIALKEHSDWKNFPPIILKYCLKKINFYDFIFANSQATKCSFENIFSKEHLNNYPCLSVDYPKIPLIRAAKKEKENTRPIKLLTVANLIKQKGFEEAINLLSILEAANIDWQWTIIGKGLFEERIVSLLLDFNLIHRVIIIPELEKNDLYQHMSNADIYIQLSYFESFGIAPLEAFFHYNKLIVSKFITSINELGLEKSKNIFIINDINNPDKQKNEIIKFIQKMPSNTDFSLFTNDIEKLIFQLPSPF